MGKNNGIRILFQDEYIIVVNKPAGILSTGHPGAGQRNMQDMLKTLFRNKRNIRICSVHRLDRETSGVMMFACTPQAKKIIMDGWNKIVTERMYRCVCLSSPGSKPLPESGTINAPITYNRYGVGFVPGPEQTEQFKHAEKAVTHFTVLERDRFSDLVECRLETGRKNQIRIHLSHLGHPLAGDPVYGQRNADSDRLFLHARTLAFVHPFSGEVMRFEEPEPPSFHARQERMSGHEKRNTSEKPLTSRKTGNPGPRKKKDRGK
ncbi:RluA family pseudouridine synthase [Brucepastera parasyntrophica]|uniref:RluA family pseudouridine synthase n=1 Tax=Brucepastera parasyntrophica TaxID=2880008 RepID=UPI0021086850|nr:RluA family pseudouridine synthase [Brucepastera parasyntrophica]ULQ60964.1 RluA family pseudouridine synthase [Brucepastera parasyntrophica]